MPLNVVVAVETASGVRRNLGTIIRCSAAMGVATILVIGNRRVGTHGSHGAQTRVNLVHFYEWKEALEYLRQTADTLLLYGAVRFASATSQSVASFAFPPPQADGAATTAVFVVGSKDGTISEAMRQRLDAELHVEIPDPTFAGRFSFDAMITICLHRFVVFAGEQLLESDARPRPVVCGEKFELDATCNQRGRVQRGRVQGKRVLGSGDGDEGGSGGEGEGEDFDVSSLFG